MLKCKVFNKNEFNIRTEIITNKNILFFSTYAMIVELKFKTAITLNHGDEFNNKVEVGTVYHPTITTHR